MVFKNILEISCHSFIEKFHWGFGILEIAKIYLHVNNHSFEIHGASIGFMPLKNGFGIREAPESDIKTINHRGDFLMVGKPLSHAKPLTKAYREFLASKRGSWALLTAFLVTLSSPDIMSSSSLDVPSSEMSERIHGNWYIYLRNYHKNQAFM